MDHHGLLPRVVIEDHNLEQLTRAAGPDDEVPATARNHTERVTHRVLDVLIKDLVLSGAVRKLHYDKVTLL